PATSPDLTPSPDQFEKLASFYLGRHYDLAAGQLRDDLLMYDAKDLCTHAMCVGMTGSGKTGLCLSLLEEAAIDGIPALCVDPKGDLANLLLAFPDLQASDFLPYIHSGDAIRKGMTVEQFAEDRAKLWKSGLASWGQSPARIKKFRDAVDISVYTPGSNLGLPLTVLKSFDAPSQEVLRDSDAMRERVTGATSGLLTLLGIEADPLLSPEHILVSSILDHCWRKGESISIGALIGLISAPPIRQVGVMDLDTFMPPSDRAKLSMRLNNLLASPAFSTWLDGETLDIGKLLYDPSGKPRLSILSIAHLSDRERMFFVTILLNELLAWTRSQSGTSSLRAMFYMDEVAGYFPPVANPPSKPPMLTLLKQARAFGVGITLATQNPVDLDYKGLSNIGTWFLGRLQTERDKARVLEGLEGASAQSGSQFDRARMEQMLASLGNRVFLMNNVHDDQPTVFQTRWALSYLAGPLSRDQISELMADKRQTVDDSGIAVTEDLSAGDTPAVAADPIKPVVPIGVEERYLPPQRPPENVSKEVYRPALICEGTLHWVRSSADLDLWRDARRILLCGSGIPADRWEVSRPLDASNALANEPEDSFTYAALPTDLCGAAEYRKLEKEFKDYLYRHQTLELYKSTLLGEYAPGGSTQAQARIHFNTLAREERDLATEKLRAKYAKKMASLDKKIRAAQDRVAREEDQYEQAKLSSIISIGSSLLGAFMGRKVASRTNVNSMSTAARAGGRAMQQKSDIGRAEDQLRDLAIEQTELNARLREEIDELSEKYAIENLELETTTIAPRKSDLKVQDVQLLWTPWAIDPSGIATPLFDVQQNQ
ncbi:MAG: ATP-binding protein, partial [Planctomycetota bacterium]